LTVPNALTRVYNKIIGKAEGQPHGPPYVLPITGGWLGSEGNNYNWWQTGAYVRPFSTSSAMVEACVSAYSQTVAMCPGDHWRSDSKGGRERVTNSDLSRILRQPNDYQSMSDFLLGMVRDLYMYGNAFAYCVRNNRYEIAELHPMMARVCWPKIAEDGSIFYSLAGNYIIQNRLQEGWLPWVPKRDVLHIKLHSNDLVYHPLLGISPLTAAAIDVATTGAIKNQQFAFFTNQARPSFVLSTDLLLEKDVVSSLRDRWNDQAAGINAGGTPILTGGLKPFPITMRSRDAQLAEALKYSDQDIALAFRVPFQILGIGGAPHGSTEVLMQEWVASGLGFCLNHVESAFDQTFQLKGMPDEYVEFNTEALLRSAFKDRIAALKDGVMGGIFSPNEARNREGLPKVKDGEEPRLQQQVVPLSAAEGISAGAPGQHEPKIPPAPPAPPQPPAPKPAEGSKLDAGVIARNSLRYAQREIRRDSL
jgi:HK97 family phage portal protein